jgi:hypothetical protein
MGALALALALCVALATGIFQNDHVGNEAAEQRIQQVITGLPSGSWLRSALLQGARGNGIRYPWMDELRGRGIKRASLFVDITFDRHGRPKQTAASHTEFFVQYDGGMPISDSERLAEIRESGLEKQLESLALQEAAHGFWLDLPRPRPKPFVGSAHVEFFDDEWLPRLPWLYSTFRPK